MMCRVKFVLIVLIACFSSVAGAQQEESVEAEPGAPSDPGSASEGEAAPSPSEGKPSKAGLRFLLFVEAEEGTTEEVSREGTKVRVGTVEGTLDESGVVNLEGIEPGYRDVTVESAAPGKPPITLTKVGFGAGVTSQILLTVNPAFVVVSQDIESPHDMGEAQDEVAPEDEGPKGRGTVAGRVLDAETKKPVAGVKVYVRGIDDSLETDAQGHFTIEVNVGLHDLSILHSSYASETLEGVEVKLDETTTLELSLNPSSAELDDMVITEPYVQGGVASVLAERRESRSVTDGIGAAEISRSPDSTASAATRRVVGATVVGGQYLFVRGLGGRYSNVRLNGVPLPSTDPDLPGFQMDLFPSSLIDNLVIAKTFTPDIPGDFAGGSLDVITRTFPEELSANVSVSTSFDTMSTFRSTPTYAGGKLDFFGFDDGTRALPDEVPDERVAVARRGREGLTSEQVDEIGRSFKNNWNLRRTTAPPNSSLGVSVGNTLRPGKQKVGFLVTGGYRYNSRLANETVTNSVLEGEGEDQELVPRETLNREQGLEQAQMGVLGTVSYEPVEEHKLSVVSLLTRSADDSTSYVTGFSENENAQIRQTEYRFIERQLLFNQLWGRHGFGPVVFDWQMNGSMVDRKQPDTRSMIYVQGQSGAFEFRETPGSGERLYSSLGQKDLGGGFNVLLDLERFDTKAGYLGRASEREFEARRFTTNLASGTSPVTLRQAPDDLFAPENIPDVFGIQEVTRPDDGYEGQESLHATYGLGDLKITEWMRAIGGVRMEAFSQAIEVRSPIEGEPIPTDEDGDPLGSERTDVDFLPSASLVFFLNEEMSVRGAYGGTVARPQLRELAPFQSADFVRRRNVTGNPDLVRTYIHNFDLRWEWFPSASEVIAVSAFMKRFLDPIETVIIDARGNVTFENILGARNYGFELEARMSLGRFQERLDNLLLTANFAYIYSRVELSDEQARLATNQERPLAGQSPYVVNVGFGYDDIDKETGPSAYLYYNVYGPRITEVGNVGLPDVYEQPFHSLDATAFWAFERGWTLGFTATNLLFQDVVIEQGEQEFSRTELGATFGLRASWRY